MSEGMPSWKSLFSASRQIISQRDFRVAIPTRRVLKPGEDGYVDGRSTPQSWSQWAGEKILRSSYEDGYGVDRITIFPGWATRRYRNSMSGAVEDAFDVDVYVSGFATNHRPLELATRSQRAFMRLAKGFASLPKLPSVSPAETDYEQPPPLTPSTEALLQSVRLPPRPTEITEEYEIEALEKQFRRAEVSVQNNPYAESDLESSTSSITSRSSSPSAHMFSASGSHRPNLPPLSNGASIAMSELRRLHANLESRLQPFWSSALSSRVVRLSLFASPHSSGRREEDNLSNGPLAVKDVLTASDGFFQARFTIPWEHLCKHPGALHIAFGNPTEEHDMLVAAELLPSLSLSQSNNQALSLPSSPPSTSSTTRISITHSHVRVISDIDDTVKLSNILSGARAVFRSVFVKELRDTVIPGMSEWYYSMWNRGVRFHYVSNGPFELLPVVNEFFQVSRLPPGSVKLKSYAGRSLFNGLLSAPAARKRGGVVDILDSFPGSRFFLIGDSGEQDLELYAVLAVERPQQILGVFIRDAAPYDDGRGGIEDPTGWRGLDTFLSGGSEQIGPVLSSGGINIDGTPRLPPDRSTSGAGVNIPSKLSIPRSTEYFPSFSLGQGSVSVPLSRTDETSPYAGTPSSASSESSSSSFTFSRTPQRKEPSMSDSERKRCELQLRVNRARVQMPGHIPLRVFGAPDECVETIQILDALHIGGGGL